MYTIGEFNFSFIFSVALLLEKKKQSYITKEKQM
jgi:hypothetical protein